MWYAPKSPDFLAALVQAGQDDRQGGRVHDEKEPEHTMNTIDQSESVGKPESQRALDWAAT